MQNKILYRDGGNTLKYQKQKISKAAKKWEIFTRCIRVLYAEGKVPGAIRKGSLYMIPENAPKPLDGRKTRAGLLAEIEEKNG